MTREEWDEWWEGFGRQEVRAILALYWDPIGVYGEAGATDEYESYLPRVEPILRRGAPAEEIVSLLVAVARDEMGMPDPAARTERAAAKVREWFADAMSWLGADFRRPVD